MHFRKAREFVQQYGFDGLDLDYEFPDASDKVNFAEWVKDIKTEFQQYNYEVKIQSLVLLVNYLYYYHSELYYHTSNYQVTAAISASPSYIQNGLDVPKLNQYLDAIHIMSYDLHGAWDSPKRADNHAPLYARSWDSQPPFTANGA